MFAPSINVDLEKMKGEEVLEEEQPKPRKAKAAPKARRTTADKSTGASA